VAGGGLGMKKYLVSQNRYFLVGLTPLMLRKFPENAHSKHVFRRNIIAISPLR
jgi:hypothetical protein